MTAFSIGDVLVHVVEWESIGCGAAPGLTDSRLSDTGAPSVCTGVAGSNG